jgi:hypothetical protein
MDQQLIERVSASILAYLEQRPASADTLDGIHRWWIDWGGRMESTEVTLRSLQLLEQQRHIESVAIGNKVLWRRPRQTV